VRGAAVDQPSVLTALTVSASRNPLDVSLQPQQQPQGFNPPAAAGGWDHALRIEPASGALLCRGCNTHHQCDPTKPSLLRIDSWQPLTLAFGAAAVRIVQVAAGARHSLALSEDGRAFAWGETNAGAGAGAGGAARDSTQEQQRNQTIQCVAGPDTQQPITQIAAGLGHSLALTQSGRVLAWGSNLQVRWFSLASMEFGG